MAGLRHLNLRFAASGWRPDCPMVVSPWRSRRTMDGSRSIPRERRSPGAHLVKTAFDPFPAPTGRRHRRGSAGHVAASTRPPLILGPSEKPRAPTDAKGAWTRPDAPAETMREFDRRLRAPWCVVRFRLAPGRSLASCDSVTAGCSGGRTIPRRQSSRSRPCEKSFPAVRASTSASRDRTCCRPADCRR